MNVKDGILTVKEIFGIPLRVDIIEPIGLPNVRTLKSMTPEGITVHNTGSGNKEAGDEAHASYLKNVEKADKEYVSWHFTVDSDSITQHLPLNEKGYHAGDGINGPGNGKTIAIEIAEGSKYPQCEANGITLICWLLHEFGWGLNAVQPHRKYSKSKKLCPWRILKSEATWQKDWENFQKNKIAVRYKELYGIDLVTEPKASVNVTDIKVGDTVKLKDSAVQWDGKNIRSDYKNKEYIVKQLDSNGRTVLTINGVVIYAVDVKFLEKVHKETKTKASQFKSYLVKITANALNIRKGPGTSYSIAGVIKDKGVYTIVEQQGDWGKLKSGAGWIHLGYTRRI